MSIYAVNFACRETLRDHGFREAMRSDPRAALARYDLTDAERDAFVAGEVGVLHAMGANDFLMGYLARFELLGLTIDIYRDRLIGAEAGVTPR